MKKTFILLFVLSLMLSACSSEWQQEKNLPEGLRAHHEQIIEEQMVILEGTPEDTTALFEVAFRYHQLGDYKNAVEYYEKVLEQNDTDWATLNNLANVYEDMEEYEQAADYIKRLYELDPTNIEVTKDTIRILLEAGDGLSAEEALANFEKQTISSESPNADLQALVAKLRADIEEWKLENSSSIN